MGIVRKILIVDDFEDTQNFIKQYYLIFQKIKDKYSIPFDLKIEWEKTIEGAINKLNKKEEVFHALIVDYDFPNDRTRWKGVRLVKEIRKINKICNIIFYTTKASHEIERDDFIDLINSNVFRFILKSGTKLTSKFPDKFGDIENQVLVEAIIDAIDDSEPISNALENYLVKYNTVLKDTKIKVNNNEYLIQEIIDSIRLDTGVGREFVDNILRVSVFDCIDFMR